MSRYFVIMAGGSGTRFWPASRKHRPKQFLSLDGKSTLLRATAERILPLTDWDKILVVTAAVHAEHARDDLPELPAENLLVEPTGRNTAPCIAWAVQEILSRDAEAEVAVLAADHFIGDSEGFHAHLEAAFSLCAKGKMVLFGIVPHRPETGYGYIKRGTAWAQAPGHQAYLVERFVEKPDVATAAGYLAEGGYLWNSGMFVFSAQLMQDNLEALLPELCTGLEKLKKSPELLETIYPQLPAVSIDVAVMEQSHDVAVLPGQFGWSDVGTWQAMHEILPKDGGGNVALGEAVLHQCQDTLVDARAGRLVAVSGLEGATVVDTKDALLVLGKGHSQQVKDLVGQIKDLGRDELL